MKRAGSTHRCGKPSRLPASAAWKSSRRAARCARVFQFRGTILSAAREIIRSAKEQVSAAELALDGVRQEYFVGSRTTLDVLDAETEVVTARIALVSAERDQIVAAYQILGSIGRLTARDLSLPVDYYDADENYLNVRGKWFGTGADTIE